MSCFKPLLTTDLITTPLILNKSFEFRSTESFNSNNVGIDIFIGQNITSSYFDPLREEKTGNIKRYYKRQVYDSIKRLYYSNYLSSSFGDTPSTGSAIGNGYYIDADGSQLEIFTGPRDTTNNYNYLSNTLIPTRSFNTEPNKNIGVISIPSNLFGEHIKLGSFKYTVKDGSNYYHLVDDKNGNIFLSGSFSTDLHVGNIIYEHGTIIITDSGSLFKSEYGDTDYGGSIYGFDFTIESFLNSGQATCSFASTLTKYEMQISCNVDADDFTFPTNPSALSGSSVEIPYDFVRQDYFNPYVTCVGLYNQSFELLAVAKMSQPIPLSNTTDTNFIINLDMY